MAQTQKVESINKPLRKRAKPKGRSVDPQALVDVQDLLGDAPRDADLLIEHLHRIQDHFGQIPADPSDPARQTLTEALTDLGRHGQHVGAMLAARTGAEDGSQLAEFIKSLPLGTLPVDFDPGGLVVNGFSATEAISELGSSIIHVHARDGTRDVSRGRGIETPLGRGSVDFPAILAALEEHDYRGYFTVERNDEQAIEQSGLAIQYLRNLG